MIPSLSEEDELATIVKNSVVEKTQWNRKERPSLTHSPLLTQSAVTDAVLGEVERTGRREDGLIRGYRLMPRNRQGRGERNSRASDRGGNGWKWII